MINNTQGNYFTKYTSKAQEVFTSETFTDAVEKFVDEKLSQFDLRYLDFNNSQTELLDDNKEPIFFNERVKKLTLVLIQTFTKINSWFGKLKTSSFPYQMSFMILIPKKLFGLEDRLTVQSTSRTQFYFLKL